MSLVAKISGVGAYVPPRVVKNKDLEEMLDTSHEWIIQRTGIEQRHWVEKDVACSDLALEASLEAIKDAGLEKEDIDMIIFATLSPDHDFPGGACFLQAKLGLGAIGALDIRQQCSGFVYGLSVADKFIKSGGHKNILLVGSEVQSKGLDLTPKGRGVSVLFGDGAGAVVVSAAEANSKNDPQVFETKIYADGSFAKELWTPGPGSAFEFRNSQAILDEGLHYPYMNGRQVFVHAIKRMSEVLVESVKASGFEMEDIDLFLFHQANLRINQKLGEMLNLPEEKVFNTIQNYGNTTAATIPLGMRDAIKAGVLRPGMNVAMAAFGSGFTWAGGVLRY